METALKLQYNDTWGSRKAGFMYFESIEIDHAHVGEPDLREAAARTLDAVPVAEAFLLFGSRARGNALPDSDWDIAVVTQGHDLRVGQCDRTPIETLHPRVSAIFLGADLLREKRNSPGHIAREILRDGHLLAGRMPSVGRIKRNPSMGHEEFVDKSTAAVNALAEAGAAFARALAEPHRLVPLGSAQSFVRHSADGAEYLAKLMMFRRGVTPPRRHDLNGLANRLESAGPDGRWGEAAAATRAMDGRTRDHHKAANVGVDANDVSHAIARLPRVCMAFIGECAEAGRDPRLRKAVDLQVAYLRQRSAIVARELAAVEPAPLESVAALTERFAAHADKRSARKRGINVAKAGAVIRESLSDLRDLFVRLAQAEPPRSVGGKRVPG